MDTGKRSYARQLFSFAGAALVWFAVFLQLYLIIEHRTASVTETILRFFSYFTILTNILVALFFTAHMMPGEKRMFWFFSRSPTAITVYITVVGLVYQVLLRHLWSPTGLQWVADELLHSVIPLFTIIYWWTISDRRNLEWKSIPSWLIYPFLYLVFVLIRGAASGFYPYPFVDVGVLGYGSVVLNSMGLFAGFVLLSALFVLIGRSSSKIE